MNTDRRRTNAPSGGTSAPVFARTVKEQGYIQSLRPERTRGPNELRKICKLYIFVFEVEYSPKLFKLESSAVGEAQKPLPN